MEAAYKAGTLVSVDASANRVVVRHGEVLTTYTVPPRAVVMREKRSVALDQFAPGTEVTVRYRIEAAEPHTVYDLTDSATWPWLTRVRREITGGRIVEVTQSGIIVEDVRDRGQMHYRITNKTRIEIGGGTAGPAALKPEMMVYVAPRLLPNGQTMASAVADSEAGGARLRERSMPTVSGTVRAVDGQKRTLEMDTRAGDRRTMRIADPCLIRRDGKDVPISQLRPGLWVTAHVRRVGEGDVVHRITVNKKPPAGVIKR